MIYKRFTAFLVMFVAVMALTSSNMIARAATPLPASSWYAVAHVRDADTLHWINANGEQASMPRPTWADEAPDVLPQIYISPDGRTLVQTVQLATGFEAIGFYDLSTGQFTNTHQAQSGERFIATTHNPFSRNSARFAIGLSAPDASAWRIINFEVPSGNVISQLTQADIEIGLPGNQYYPYMVHYGLDEGLGQYLLQFQMHTQLPDAQFAMYQWYPEMLPNQQVPQTSGMSSVYNNAIINTFLMHPAKGFDILPLTGFPVLAHGDGLASQFIEANVNGQPNTSLISESNDITIDRVRWLKGGEWVGYHREGGQFNDHWRVLDAATGNPVTPLGPNFSMLHGTPDGYLAQDGMQARLMHVTTLDHEAFSSDIGNMVFQPFSYYRVVYVTPVGASFSLLAVPADETPAVAVGGQDVQAPEVTCGDAPAPRLTVGKGARVTFTTGTPLNVRTAAAGDLLMQIKEGTQVNVVNGPICANNYLWWEIQMQSENVTVGGWAAEGDNENYYLEPYENGQVNPDIAVGGIVKVPAPVDPTPAPPLQVAPPVNPTPVPPLQVAPPVNPTPVPPLQVAPPVNPTPVPPLQVAPPQNCNQSPPAQVSVGGFARTLPDANGTLAVYPQANSEFPTAQIPANTGMKVDGGPTCRGNGQRMWLISLTLNGQAISGWVAEGYGQTYFIVPGLPRAS